MPQGRCYNSLVRDSLSPEYKLLAKENIEEAAAELRVNCVVDDDAGNSSVVEDISL